MGGWSQGGFLTKLCSVRNGSHDGGWRFQAAITGSGFCDIDSIALGSPVVPRMLILHGEADTRCHVTQSWGLRRALRSYGLPFELVNYPFQGHVFEAQKYWVDMALRTG